jgi:hypothetical protein
MFLIAIALTHTKYSVAIWYEDFRLKTECRQKYADMTVDIADVEDYATRTSRVVLNTQ